MAALATIFAPVWIPIAIVGGTGYLTFKGGRYILKKAKKGASTGKNRVKELWVAAKCQTRCTKKRCLDNAEVLFNCVNKCPSSTIKNCVTSDIDKIVTLASDHIKERSAARSASEFYTTYRKELDAEIDQKYDLLWKLKEIQKTFSE